ncbi:MAG: HD domain-containing protein [Candidatus Sumerlaeia bacterium]
MNHVAINTLKPNDQIVSVYYLDRLEIKKKRDGEDYAQLTVRDATGSLPAVMWEGLAAIQQGSVRAESFVEIEGRIGQYRDQLQLVISSIRPVPLEEVDKQPFLPVSPTPRQTLLAQLDETIAGVKDRDLKMLLVSIFQDDEDLRAKFAEAPSAMKMHQAYLGGLLEHTLKVLRVALSIAEHYPGYNRDLLVSATLLHDLGKIWEFEYETSIRYSDRGRLIGHIVLGIELVHEKIRAIGGMPEEKSVLLIHTILAHHGEREWGSPKRPKTLEALILHFADLLDSRLSTFMEHKRLGQEQGRSWSEFIPIFDRAMYLAEAPSEAADDDNPLQSS